MKDPIEFEYSAPGCDPVAKQYESLPYPPIKEIELREEEEFYKRNIHIKSFVPSDALENINHYLHRGRENFG